MTRRPHGWRVGLLAMVSMLMLLVAPALPAAAQADPATEFSTTISQLPTMTPVAGPLSGSIDAANAQIAPAGVSVANGVAHAEFTVPAVTAGTLWAIAMEFRASDAGKNFLLIFPDGSWQLDNGVQGGAVTGTGATFDTTAGATVALDVIFNGASWLVRAQRNVRFRARSFGRARRGRCQPDRLSRSRRGRHHAGLHQLLGLQPGYGRHRPNAHRWWRGWRADRIGHGRGSSRPPRTNGRSGGCFRTATWRRRHRSRWSSVPNRAR